MAVEFKKAVQINDRSHGARFDSLDIITDKDNQVVAILDRLGPSLFVKASLSSEGISWASAEALVFWAKKPV